MLTKKKKTTSYIKHLNYPLMRYMYMLLVMIFPRNSMNARKLSNEHSQLTQNFDLAQCNIHCNLC